MKLLLICLLITGCEEAKRLGDRHSNYRQFCIDGVSWIEGYGFASVNLGLDGKPRACK